ncbi:MAG: hypothetical protein AABW48_01645 [Nanoarchaeota archaeon]|mgnify:CR=1 FL=1
MSTKPDLVEKLNLTSSSHLQDVNKDDFVEEVLNLYQATDYQGMSRLFRAYTDFLLRGAVFNDSVKTEETTFTQAKKNLSFITYAADLVQEGYSVFEVLKKAQTTKREDRKTGLVTKFFQDAIKDYQLITLPGYNTLYNGGLYSKAWLLPDEQNTRLLSFVLLRRYTSPTEQEIVSCLQQAVINANRFELGELAKTISSGNKVEEPKTLEQMIARNLAEQTRLDLMVGEEEKLNLLASKTKAFFEKTGVTPGQQFLDLKYALVPDDFIKKGLVQGYIEGLNGYAAALLSTEWQKHLGLGLRWGLSQLPYTGGLPARERISFAEIPATDQKDAEEVINALYAALVTPNHFAQLLDASNLFTEETALKVVGYLNGLKAGEQVRSEQLVQQYSSNLFGKKPNPGKAN